MSSPNKPNLLYITFFCMASWPYIALCQIRLEKTPIILDWNVCFPISECSLTIYGVDSLENRFTFPLSTYNDTLYFMSGYPLEYKVLTFEIGRLRYSFDDVLLIIDKEGVWKTGIDTTTINEVMDMFPEFYEKYDRNGTYFFLKMYGGEKSYIPQLYFKYIHRAVP